MRYTLMLNMGKSKVPASKETLSGLIENTSNVIQNMYACLLTDIRALERLEVIIAG